MISQAYDLQLKADFPILMQQVGRKEATRPLIYLDSAATSQKPKQVIDAISDYYTNANANVHRGVHTLSDRSTTAYEAARHTIARFFNADPESLLLVRNTTEATNGVAYGWGDDNMQAGDVIVTTLMEHHSSLVVWQQLAARQQATLEVIGVTEQGYLDYDQLELVLKKYGKKVKLVACVHVSNTLGTVNDVALIGEMVRRNAPQARFYVDAAQSAPHLPLSFKHLQTIGVDFLAISGHKMLGPMGIGCLLVRSSLLTSGECKPWLFGGGMIAEVTTHQTTFADAIQDRFTAGTPDVASAVGLAAACEYLDQIGMQRVADHDQALVAYTLSKLTSEPTISKKTTIIGPLDSSQRVGSVAFVYHGVHAHDVAQILDAQGIAVRSGHHCTMPLHTAFGWQATVRASFNVYTTHQDIDALIAGLREVERVFGV